ncbi:bifunctional glutamate N-acetyltransferase/amino-acid acetyltransferase ArgJ [Bermanella marisrubri]|uniref:Arginine biosynthesis bifunctional protein ArgJ n=1 Tax=Bermanella marisrubri TaxID=207949 RepID=Q1MZP3_9GAMM|nr:bifunctional glutamate N-acetyltransferase/amino-acid acetyltransferase ArgJ [Bermanella marisrubri]EAT11514.1 arginine biosynthesis bifunctional protein ArgJ [Oceanobacter sp. RED65] [Bermanella marisrubri]QIZ85087.1 bifunctional glutamate N-acetyltransferase/amino-acid acetyltransferase ArgJ [Bermanella marisrubri]
MPVNLNVLEQFHAVKGIEIATANAGIKQTERPDIVVFKLSEHTRTAGIFTQNAFCAAPVTICKQHLQQTQARMLLINTGNANAGTGQTGFDNAMELCQVLAEANSVAVNEILPFSTGVIGEPLPMQKILPVVKSNLNFSESIWFDASRGIMTTDIQPKGFSKQVEIQGETITVSGISKGSGMIKPNMATMLGFIATDATVSQEIIEQLCSELGEQSFNRITVDGDTSTNDSCILMATCEAQNKPIESEKSEGYSELKSVLLEAFQFLAQAIVRDGEGATKFVTIQVEAAKTQREALDVAYTVAHSPLVKTALFASDANWGRILAAVGRAGIDDLDLHHIEIYLDDVCIVEKGGRAASYTEEAGSKVMAQDEIQIRIHLGRGKESETVWTTDLSHGYVTINAEYRT